MLEMNQASNYNHVIELNLLGLVGRLIAGYAEIYPRVDVLYLAIKGHHKL